MPLFWKKSIGKEGSPSSYSPVKSPASPLSNGSVGGRSPDISESAFQCLQPLKNIVMFPETPKRFVRKSRLSQTLKQVLKDPGARQHFLQFLETNGTAHLLRFWLDANSFRAVAETRLSSGLRHDCLSVTTSPKSGTDRDDSPGSLGLDEMVSSASPVSVDDQMDEELRIDGSTLGDPRRLTRPNEDTGCPENLDCGKVSQEAHSKESVVNKLHKSIESDAVSIFTKYIAKDAAQPIGVPDDLRDEVMRRICSEDGHVDPGCFESAQQFVYEILNNWHFPAFLQSVNYCRHQLDVLTNGTVCLPDILYNETSLSFFMEFIEQEGQRDLLEFWLAADNFYQHLSSKESYNGSEAQDDAMVLYDKYFSLQAKCPLGFSDGVRFEVEQNICREGGPLPDCFENAVAIVLNVLEKTYLSQFLGSQLYVKYLTELVNMVQMNLTMVEKKKRTGSDCSSEHSVQTINTLLAMDGTQPGVATRRIVKRFDDEDMRIDTCLFVPDTLWKRRLAGKLLIGYVNGMGQFITEFEPEPDKKWHAGIRLSKAVKRLVYREEDKTKEEMALQIAKMIIQEVLTITMGAAGAKLCNS